MSALSGQTISVDWLFNEIADIVNERNSQPWRADAACLGLDTDLFFPTRGVKNDEALAVCATCPVAEPCREYALSKSYYNLLGVFGGTSIRERRRIQCGEVAA